MARITSSNSSLVWSDASHCKIIDYLLWNFRQDLSGQICSSKLSKSKRKISDGHGPNIPVKYIYQYFKGPSVPDNSRSEYCWYMYKIQNYFKISSMAQAQRGMKEVPGTIVDLHYDKIIAVVITAIIFPYLLQIAFSFLMYIKIE